jgi:Tol biopolymer transport system component
VADRGGGIGDIYYIHVRDTLLNVTTRINANAEGAPPNGASHRAVISRDGAYVAFSSTATNLVSGDRNRSSDVFLYEVRTGSITLVSRSVSGRPANGTSRNPSISADGRFVAFQSDASDLVCARNCPSSGEDINLVSDVFLFDRVTGLTTWVSTGGAGGWMEESVAPVLDAAGRVLAFMSRHPTDDGDIEHDFDLFVRLPAAGGR